MNYLLWLIRRFEGCKLVAYLCPAGIWTNGWGSTGPDVRQGVTWTQEYADERMQRDARTFYNAVAKASPILVTTDATHDAIADFAYNLGVGRYRASTLKRRIDEGDFEEAIQELGKWVRGGGKVLKGLVDRRRAEAELIAGEMLENK